MSTKSQWEYFSVEELACQCGCGGGAADMDPEFMERLVLLRAACGFPFPVTSAYRCPAHNATVSSTGLDGPHTTGRAIDIAVSRARARTVLSLANEDDFPGIGVCQHGGSRFLHLDRCGHRCWSYP